MNANKIHANDKYVMRLKHTESVQWSGRKTCNTIFTFVRISAILETLKKHSRLANLNTPLENDRSSNIVRHKILYKNANYFYQKLSFRRFIYVSTHIVQKTL